MSDDVFTDGSEWWQDPRNFPTLTRTFVTSDTHIGHENVLRHDGRPFPTIEEHDAAILANTIRTVPRGATLIHLGDVAGMRVKSAIPYLEALRAAGIRVRLIKGNHDDKLHKLVGNLVENGVETDVLYLRLDSERFFLSHYAHRTWRNSHHGSYHLYGHSHGALPNYGRSMDVGVMVHDYKPISLFDAMTKLHDAPPTNHHRDLQKELDEAWGTIATLRQEIENHVLRSGYVG